MIEISAKRYADLLKAEYVLGCLEAYGVDNWTWYDDALNAKENNISARDIMNEMTTKEIIDYLG